MFGSCDEGCFIDFTIISFSLFGCANEYDLDDLEKLKKVASTAILESALTESEDFMSTFSGWAKRNHSNGQLESLTMYKDGKWDGPCVFWFENGLKMYQGNYLNGREHGEWRFWRMDGTNSQVQTFDNGEKDGPYVWWHPNGKKKWRELSKGELEMVCGFSTTSKASRTNSFHTIWELSYFRLIE